MNEYYGLTLCPAHRGLDYEFIFNEALYMCGFVENIFLYCSLHVLLWDFQVFYHKGVNFMT